MTTRLAQLVADVHGAFDVDAAVAQVRALLSVDRPQASRGIEEAAEMVAAWGREAGLDDVEILRFPADGAVRWWTFQAPRPFTPIRASLNVVDPSEPVARSPEVACSLATYSAATAEGGVVAPLVRWDSRAAVTGAIAVIDDAASLPLAIEEVEAAGALGFVTDLASRRLPDGEVGRVELSVHSGMFGFSVSPAAMAAAVAAAQRGGAARVEVALDAGDAQMPVVTGMLGQGGDEVWLLAHLCHRSPGANDNLSGVAALLGIAAALAPMATASTGIRFLWAPEFVGTAAYLHRQLEELNGAAPVAVIDLDMVGEDQSVCGGPLILERTPDHRPHFLNSVVEHALDALPGAARSYSGAVAVRTWAWQATPFVGASDHAVFADRSVGVPAVQLGHWPDRFQHSSADTIDKLDPAELRRAAAAAGASAFFVASRTAADAVELEDLAFAWGLRRVAEADGAAELAHAVAVAAASLLTASASPRAERLAASLRGLEDATHTRRAQCPSDRLLRRRWPGPFNLRALVGQLGPTERHWMLGVMGTNRATFPAATALALAIDDASDRNAVIERASLSSRIAIGDVFDGERFADRFLDCLVAQGWADEERVDQ